MKKAFTLIELLIVIGILSVLVVTILITLNPAEAQKKARDTKRMKDLATLQAIVEQWISDGKEPFCTGGAYNGCYSDAPIDPNAQPCNASWIRTPGTGGSIVNLCDYAKTIPSDPRNSKSGTIVTGGTVTSPTMAPVSNMFYYLKMSGSDYEIGVMQESKSNADNTLNDGGAGSSANQWAEVGSKLDLL